MVFRKTLKRFCLRKFLVRVILDTSLGGGGGGGTLSPKLCIEARGKVHFEIVIATVVRNFDLTYECDPNLQM